MINALNLIWIIPLSALVGMLSTAFMTASSMRSNEYEAFQDGVEQGKKSCRHKTLQDIYTDFNTFQHETGGFLYGQEESGQMSLIAITSVEALKSFYSNPIISIMNDGRYKRPILKV